ncbi:uncharacterized protein LOC103510421 [Diaphorina citri]|uniref:Uncharacterized protein LOC103510421 n=1 Tax=Diaphorina citri TaxID=121845 RepID=A0A3Q0IZZ8_DIACI|nr:uncharacterized protein LOC103510421 [Diaphorina citri]
MNIFCKEAQEHLDLHPDSISESNVPSFSSTEESALITPELWMNNHEDSPPLPPDNYLEYNTLSRHSSSETPSPPPPFSSKTNGTPSATSKMKTNPTKKKKLLEKQNFQMKFKKIPHYAKSHLMHQNPSLSFYRSSFPNPSMMFDLPSFRNSSIRNPPPLLRIVHPTVPPHQLPNSSQVPSSISQALPPPTTLVPYPFIIPLPIPVPIIIPLPINPDHFHTILNAVKKEKNNEEHTLEKEAQVDKTDCQTNKPMKKRKKMTSITYCASSSSDKPEVQGSSRAIIIDTKVQQSKEKIKNCQADYQGNNDRKISRTLHSEYADNTMSEILGWYGSVRSNRSNFTVSPAYPTSPSGSHNSYSAESEDDSCNTTIIETNTPGKLDVCGWCSKTIKSEPMFSIDEKIFCSEVCFTQCRRASFKKNKTCDWCRHIRHTVNYGKD